MAGTSTKKFTFLIGVLAIAGLGVWFATRPDPIILQGEVSADRYDVSARVSGRVVELGADVGDTVEKGDLLVMLESPELQASLQTRKATVEVARADYERIITVRDEEVAARQAELEAAEAELGLREHELGRLQRLRESPAFSQAQLDVAVRNRDSALKRRDVAQATLQLTKEGASEADRQLARARVEEAEAALQSVQAQISELSVKAPVGGLVTTRVAEIGENFSPGAPLISLVDMNDLWFTFNVREDFLEGIEIGDVRTVRVPALADREVEARVTLMNVLGQFAAWRATRATGDFDLRTFEIRGKPVEPVEGLRPGMSAVVNVPVTER
ncbi:HlyD family secretion protein [Leisingera sp. ANG59]|uniref:HlyD family secretion protein n=1 Tax=Leisingera sp. ANG59 TaxID=2675221 RepID=UPI001574512B|nr:efflux RND transporter periplasmic adaptor subunit [Leisingera sp. ANG59]NSY41326.1 HlyD family efflux transporter periplasmic adaptor subunit [Leisingera sp. ANG59]